MINVFGFSIQLPPGLEFLGNVYGSFAITVIAWVLIAALVYIVFTYLLRSVTRHLPGEIDDIILHVVRRPLLVFVVAYGIVTSLQVLALPPDWIDVLQRLYQTVAILVGAWLAWRVLKDVLVYYGEAMVRRTESRVDDIVIPIVNLFGGLLIVIVAALLILPLYGINVTSVLVGAGVIGLVLGLALQDTLSNVFSGISLLADAPFRTGDLIVIGDGKVCRVDKIGLRTTQLYYLDEHSDIFIPNRALTADRIVNITKPTVDLRITIDVGVSYDSDLPHVENVLRDIGISHPNLLVSDLEKKIERVKAATDDLRHAAEMSLPGPGREEALARIEKHERALERLAREHTLHQEKKKLEQSLEQLKEDIHVRETGGFTQAELRELYERDVNPLDEQVRRVIAAMDAWSELPDPWAEPIEVQASYARWQRRNDRLRARWNAFKHALLRPRGEQELRLDDMTQALVDWLREDYKYATERWKDPSVNFIGFGASSVDLRLAFYLDDIRLEHMKRRTRVVRELGNAIHERFKREGIEIPFPQMDVFFKNQPTRATDGQSEERVTREKPGLGRI